MKKYTIFGFIIGSLLFLSAAMSQQPSLPFSATNIYFNHDVCYFPNPHEFGIRVADHLEHHPWLDVGTVVPFYASINGSSTQSSYQWVSGYYVTFVHREHPREVIKK